MDIDRIQELSKLYNEVALFFSRYESRLRQEGDKLVLKPTPIACTANDFRVWYGSFREVLSVLVLSYRRDTVQDIIGYYFNVSSTNYIDLIIR